MSLEVFFKYLFVMAFVTYLLRALPFILLKRQIENVFWKSFLAYIPYTVLALIMAGVIFYAHRENIMRLRNGTEPSFGRKHK